MPAVAALFMDYGVAAAYVGPGDIKSGASAYWGFRAYNTAAIGSNVCDIKRASDSTTQTFVSLAGGAVDTASIATFLNATTGKVTKFYDQTGNGHHATNASSDFAYTPSVFGSLPAIVGQGTANSLLASALASSTGAQSVSLVIKTSANVAGPTSLVGPSADAGLELRVNGGHFDLLITQTADVLSSTSIVSASTKYAVGVDTDGSGNYHIFTNGAADGATAAGMPSAGTWGIGGTGTTSVDPAIHTFAEVIIYGSVLASGDYSNLSSNQHTFWGF